MIFLKNLTSKNDMSISYYKRFAKLFFNESRKEKKIKNINFWNKIVGNIKSISKKKILNTHHSPFKQYKILSLILDSIYQTQNNIAVIIKEAGI